MIQTQSVTLGKIFGGPSQKPRHYDGKRKTQDVHAMPTKNTPLMAGELAKKQRNEVDCVTTVATHFRLSLCFVPSSF